MIFRGVELIKPIEINVPGTSKKELQFDNALDYSTRLAWLRAGFPVYYDPMSNKSYVIVDRNLRLEDTVSVDAKCECGTDKVGASRHSQWCGKYA